MEEKLNLVLKVLALRLRLDYGFTNPLVENLVKEIDETIIPFESIKPKDAYFESCKELIKSQAPAPKRGRPCKVK